MIDVEEQLHILEGIYQFNLIQSAVVQIICTKHKVPV